MLHVTIKTLPLSLSATDAADYLGSAALLEEMRRAKWIAPVVSRHKLTLFDRSELEKCYARIRAGDYPKPKPK